MEIKVMENENEVYIKDKLLGEGAFGKAYLVKHKQSEELLVIKEMNIQHMSSKEKEETIKEAQILKNLNHPNIVHFKEVYITKNNKLKIVMEYAECGDLAKAISLRKAKKNYFEESQILDWFTQICLAIKHVHDRKILHRDIKGQNIFIAKNNSLKLGDFGIARVLNKTHEKARTVVGTPYYLSPEIIENKPYSFKSDIWSIGAVLYEMCALSPPFTAASLQMLALKIVKGSYPAIQTNYSKELKALISEMLTLDPNRRPSINDILQKSVIKDRIRKFLSETKRISEFSHTILHNQKVQILANKLVQIQKEKSTPQQQQQQLRVEPQRPKSRERNSSQNNNNNNYSKEKDIEKQRLKLKEDQARMEAAIQRRKEEERKKEQKRKQDEIKRKQEDQRRREEDKKKWLKYEQEKREQMQREQDERMRMAEMMKARRNEEEKEYQRKMEIEDMRRQQYEYQDQRWKENEQNKKKMKQIQEERKKQELNDFARKQYFENLEIRKRAQERAKREHESYYSEPPQPEPDQNFHYKNQGRPTSSQEKKQQSYVREQKPNYSEYHQKPKAPEYEPTEEELVNAFVNPNYKKKAQEKRRDVESAKQAPSQRRSSMSDIRQKKDDEMTESQKRIEDAREKMRRDRENFAKNKGKEKNESEEPIQVGKWGKKRSNSREGSREKDNDSKGSKGSRERESPRFKTPESPKNQEGKGFNTLIDDSENLFLEAKNPAQFENYIGELQNILNDVHERIEKLPEIPIAEEVMFREDDELEFSLTAENPIIKKPEAEIDTEETDLDYFSNYSKLETLRIQLEQAFGLDNFIRLYRYIEKKVGESGLQGFDFHAANKEVGSDIDQKVLTKNITLLLTLVSMEDRMNCS